MKAFLLAAGRGTRISRMVQEVPKSTLPVAGVPLIARSVDLLQSKGFEVIVCVGYRQDLIREALKDFQVAYYYNPFFEVTNSIASLWMAREELEGEALIMNADVYFSRAILELIMDDDRDAVLLTDETRCATGDYFFSVTDNGCIRKYGKELPLQLRSCEYVGMAKVSAAFMPRFRERMEKLVNDTKYNLWWENTLYSFTDEDEHPIHTKDVGGRFWSEIDYFDDYERILNHIASKEAKG